MLTDVFFVALTVALMVWGYKRGVSVGVLVAVGFALGALFGSRVGPQLLSRGLHDPLAPAVALPAALLMGGAFAIGAERLGFELRRRFLRRRYTLDSILGAVLGAFLGVVLAWVIGIAAAQIDGLEGTVRDSEVITQLNTALPPPGPLVNPDRTYNIKLTRRDNLKRPGDAIKHAPAVENAAHSVVKMDVTGCQGTGQASGWVAANGFIVTNAHVTHKNQRFAIRVEGGGDRHMGTPVLFNPRDDISILRVPGVKGVPSLPIGPIAKKNQPAAVLGFPYGKRYKARAARMGQTITAVVPRPGGRDYRSKVTQLRSDVGPGPGSSGGPIVDTKGQVVAMEFGGAQIGRGRDLFAVPSSSIKRDLERALESPDPVDTGSCDEPD